MTAPDARFILVYTNDDGTVTTSHRHWTIEEARRRVALLNRSEAPDYGRWTIYETNEVET